MEKQRNSYEGLPPYAATTIRIHAYRLAQSQAIPGMAVEDYEQELAADLWRRLPAYDPRQAGISTFIDRIVRKRVAGFLHAGRAAKRRAERDLLSLDGLGDEAQRAGGAKNGDNGWIVGDRLADEVGLRHDLARFVAALPPALRRCCEILIAGSVTEAARTHGLHRASYYEGCHRLRRRAYEAALDVYLG